MMLTQRSACQTFALRATLRARLRESAKTSWEAVASKEGLSSYGEYDGEYLLETVSTMVSY